MLTILVLHQTEFQGYAKTESTRALTKVAQERTEPLSPGNI